MVFTDSTMTRTLALRLLALILPLALFLRLWGVFYGLPYTYILDETFLVNHALAFGTGDLNPHFFEWPGSLLMYALFLLYGVYFVAGLVFGIFSSTESFALRIISDPTHIYLIGRVGMALISVATVYLTYEAGRLYFDRRTGVIAALFMACSPLLSGVSHFVLTDTPLVLAVIGGLVVMHGIVESGSLRSYVLSGAVIGLGASIKYNAAALVIPIAVAHALHLYKSRHTIREALLHRGPLLAAVALPVAFFMGCPYALIDFHSFLADVMHQFSRVNQIGNIGAEHSSTLLFYVRSFAEGVGTAAAVASGAGVAYLIARRRPVEAMAPLSFTVAYFAYISTLMVGIDKYLAPAIPPALVIGAHLLSDIYGRFFSGSGIARGAAAALLVLMAAEPLYDSVHIDATLSREDTRTMAKEWIESNISSGTKIAIDAGRFDIAKLSPPIAEDEESLRRTYIEGYRETGNRFLQTEKSSLAKRYELQRKVHYPVRYSIERIVISSDGAYDPGMTLRGLIAKGVEYAVVSSFAYEGYESEAYRRNHPEAAEHYSSFYHDLDKTCDLVKVFPALPEERQGPTIKIYRLPLAPQ